MCSAESHYHLPAMKSRLAPSPEPHQFCLVTCYAVNGGNQNRNSRQKAKTFLQRQSHNISSCRLPTFITTTPRSPSQHLLSQQPYFSIRTASLPSHTRGCKQTLRQKSISSRWLAEKGNPPVGKQGQRKHQARARSRIVQKLDYKYVISCSSRLLSPCLFCARIRRLRRFCLASQPAIELHSLLEYDRDPGLSCASPILRPTRARLERISVTRHF